MVKQAELVPTARELGIGFLAYSPLVNFSLTDCTMHDFLWAP